MMLTNSIFHQVFSPLTILAAQTVASQTVLYGGVILKATQSAMLVVSLFSSKKSFLLCYRATSEGGWAGHVSPRRDRAISWSHFHSHSIQHLRRGAVFLLGSFARVRVLAFFPIMDTLYFAMPYPCPFVSKTISLVLASNTVVPRV